MTRLIKVALAAVALALLAAPAMAATTVADGSFETPEVGTGPNAYTYDPTTVIGVVFAGGAGVQGNGSDWGFNNAPDGDQTGFLQNVASITSLVTGLDVGHLYSVSFYDALRPATYLPNPYAVFFNAGSIGGFTPASMTWTPRTTSMFRALAGVGSLEFVSSTVGGDHDVGIDAIRFNDLGAVPEPAAWALMIVGFGGVGSMLRRRRQAIAA